MKKIIPAACAGLLACAPAFSAEVVQTDDVIVTATRQETRVSEVLADVTVIDRQEIERNGAGTVADLLAHQPGIQMSSSGSNGPGSFTSIFIRGANAEHTKVLVDGIPIGGAYDQAGTKALTNLPLDNVERIEIVRGPASSLYGADAIGGVIQVFTRKGTPGLKADGFAGFGSWGTTKVNAGVSGGDERWRFRVEVGRDKTNGFSSQKNATNQDADRDGYHNNAAAISLSFMPAQGHELGLTYRHNDGQTRYDSGDFLGNVVWPADNTYDYRVDFRTEQWQLYSRNQITDIWTSKLQYGQTQEKQANFFSDWDWGSFSFVHRSSSAEIENRLLSWQNDVSLPLGKALLGVERLEQNAVNPDPTYGFGSKDTTNNAVLAGWTGNWNAHSWQLSGRHDDHSQYGGKSTGTIAYGYQLTPEWRARGSYGTAFKSPTFSQLYMPAISGGNPLLKPEEARNGELGLVWESGTQSVSTTYYLNRIRNLIISGPNFPFPYENVAKARLEGVTLAYAGRFDDWDVHANYDWLDATDDTTGLQLQRRARNKALFTVDKRWGSLQTGVEVVAEGSRYDGKNEVGKIGGYSLVNLTARYAVNKTVALEGRVNNLFDRDYELSRADWLNHTSNNTYNTPGLNAFFGIRYTPE